MTVLCYYKILFDMIRILSNKLSNFFMLAIIKRPCNIKLLCRKNGNFVKTL